MNFFYLSLYMYIKKKGDIESLLGLIILRVQFLK